MRLPLLRGHLLLGEFEETPLAGLNRNGRNDPGKLAHVLDRDAPPGLPRLTADRLDDETLRTTVLVRGPLAHPARMAAGIATSRMSAGTRRREAFPMNPSRESGRAALPVLRARRPSSTLGAFRRRARSGGFGAALRVPNRISPFGVRFGFILSRYACAINRRRELSARRREAKSGWKGARGPVRLHRLRTARGDGDRFDWATRTGRYAWRR